MRPSITRQLDTCRMVNSTGSSPAANIVTLDYEELLDEHVDKRAKIEEASLHTAWGSENGGLTNFSEAYHRSAVRCALSTIS